MMCQAQKLKDSRVAVLRRNIHKHTYFRTERNTARLVLSYIEGHNDICKCYQEALHICLSCNFFIFYAKLFCQVF